jgi:hypothetical protein
MRRFFGLSLLLLSAIANARPGDINADGHVDGADLEVMRGAFYGYDARADLNGDGQVNFADLALLKAATTGAAPAALLVAPNITLLPATQNVAPNGTVSLELWMDFTEDPTLGGGIDTTFDPNMLSFVSFTFDPALGDDPAFRRQPNLEAPGQLNALAFGNFDGLSGPARVGTFLFNTLSAFGTTPITNESDEPNGPAGPFVSANTFQPIDVTYNNATVTIGGQDISAPTSVPMGAVRLGQVEQKVVTVTNAGFAPLTLGVIGAGNPLAPPFAIAANTCNNQVLQPGGTCTFRVRLSGAPPQGAKNDSFSIPSDDPDTPVLNVTTTGTVVPRVGVTGIAGITTTNAVCTNQNTGQSVNVNLAGATTLDCEAAGLSPVSPNHLVIIQINGTRVAGPQVGGVMRSAGLSLVQCVNLTSGQTRNFDPAPPGPTPRNWNCLGGGWTATPGNSVRMTVRGPAD